jgi:hypothetical protein
VGFKDAQVLALIAAEYEVAGRWEQAAEILAWAVQSMSNPNFEVSNTMFVPSWLRAAGCGKEQEGSQF